MPATRTEYILSLQTAIQARLTGDGTLMALVTGVFDQPPQSQPCPFISYGTHIGGNWHLFGFRNSEIYFYLDIFSTQIGSEECYRVLAEVNRLLETTPANPPLTMPEWGQVLLSCEWNTATYDLGHKEWHMSARYHSIAVEI